MAFIDHPSLAEITNDYIAKKCPGITVMVVKDMIQDEMRYSFMKGVEVVHQFSLPVNHSMGDYTNQIGEEISILQTCLLLEEH